MRLPLAALPPLCTLALGAVACTTPSAPPPAPASPAASSVPAAATMAAPTPTPSSTTATDAADPLVGKPAPDFISAAQDGTTVHLAALKGKPVVIYFYPKDETPGCTKEACSFRDAWATLAKSGATLVGVSADTLESHKKFVDHWKLPFLLVSDPDDAIGKLFNVPFEGVHRRQTIVIGPDGIVKKVYRAVDVSAHAQQITNDLAHLT